MTYLTITLDTPTKDILDAYNTLASNLGETIVNKFADRKTAERRYAAIVERANGSSASQPAPAPAPAPAPEKPATVGKTRIAKGAEVKQLRRAKVRQATIPGDKTGGKVRAATGKRGFYFKRTPTGTLVEPREGTKRARVLQLLLRKEGATHAEVTADIGWDERTAYEGMRLISIAHGYGLDHDLETGRVHAYADKADSWDA